MFDEPKDQPQDEPKPKRSHKKKQKEEEPTHIFTEDRETSWVEEPLIITDSPLEGSFLADLSKLPFELLKDEMAPLTKDRAEVHVRHLKKFKGERKVEDRHAQYLYDLMRIGQFNPWIVIIATAVLDGIIYAINGQHTCWAAKKLGYEPVVRWLHYKVNNEEELKQLYNTFDAHKSRTASHRTHIELTCVEGLRDTKPHVLKSVAAALRFWLFESDYERRRCSPVQLGALIKGPHLDLFTKVAKFVQEQGQARELNHVRRIAVQAAMLETFSRSPEHSIAFWKSVFYGTDVGSITDPRLQLRNFLLDVRIGSVTSRGVRSVSEEEMYNHCIPSFNKWRKGESVSRLVPTKSRVKALP